MIKLFLLLLSFGTAAIYTNLVPFPKGKPSFTMTFLHSTTTGEPKFIGLQIYPDITLSHLGLKVYKSSVEAYNISLVTYKGLDSINTLPNPTWVEKGYLIAFFYSDLHCTSRNSDFVLTTDIVPINSKCVLFSTGQGPNEQFRWRKVWTSDNGEKLHFANYDNSRCSGGIKRVSKLTKATFYGSRNGKCKPDMLGGSFKLIQFTPNSPRDFPSALLKNFYGGRFYSRTVYIHYGPNFGKSKCKDQDIFAVESWLYGAPCPYNPPKSSLVDLCLVNNGKTNYFAPPNYYKPYMADVFHCWNQTTIIRDRGYTMKDLVRDVDSENIQDSPFPIRNIPGKYFQVDTFYRNVDEYFKLQYFDGQDCDVNRFYSYMTFAKNKIIGPRKNCISGESYEYDSARNEFIVRWYEKQAPCVGKEDIIVTVPFKTSSGNETTACVKYDPISIRVTRIDKRIKPLSMQE